MAEWVTGGDPQKLANLAPGSKDFVDPAAYDEMRSFRKPIANTHVYIFYLLAIAVFLHIGGVVVTEVRGRQGLVSAMITGEKVLSEQPLDAESEIGKNRRDS